MIRLLYNLLFAAGFLFVAPRYGWKMYRRGKSGRGFGQRFGVFGGHTRQEVLRQQGGIWIHAVSVGEVSLASLLIREWRRRDPSTKIVLSTTTPTGQSVAQKEVGDAVPIIFNPLDFPACVRAAFNLIRPRVLVLVEAEVWPNYFWEAERRGVPVVMVNARLSRRTEGRYRRFSWFISPLLQQMRAVCVQNARDAERFQRLGLAPERVVDTGSMKFDVSRISWNGDLEPAKILGRAGWAQGEPVFLAASTHRGEEAIVARVFLRLQAEFEHLYFVVAPRHMERGGEISRVLREAGLPSCRRSRMDRRNGDGPARAMVLDSTGELKHFYGLAGVTFVGKSLEGRGGQNFLEPVQAGTPVIFGPHMENFEAIADEFVREGAVIRVANEEALYQAVRRLLLDRAFAAGMAATAKSLFDRRLGATARTVDVLAAWTHPGAGERTGGAGDSPQPA